MFFMHAKCTKKHNISFFLVSKSCYFFRCFCEYTLPKIYAKLDMTNEGQEGFSFLTPNHTLKNSANFMYLKLIMTLKRSKVIVDDTERREDSIELSWKYDHDRLKWLLSFLGFIKEIFRKLHRFDQPNNTGNNSLSSGAK